MKSIKAIEEIEKFVDSALKDFPGDSDIEITQKATLYTIKAKIRMVKKNIEEE